MRTARLVILLAALAGAACQAAKPAAPVRPTPKLLVILVVDQMRYDYITRMEDRWQHGLRRLVSEGAVFEQNFYPYLQTVTCAGHATIGTGAFPATHGIILNAWWRGTASAACTADADARAVGYEPNAEETGHSGRQLQRQTLADHLRARHPDARVVTLSVKPRSAIMLAGHGGIATWIDEKNAMATSTAFAETPHPAVQAYVEAHPRTALRSEVWEPRLPPDAYTGSDDGVAEAAPRGWSPTFPHPLSGAPGTPEHQFFTLWATSPYADAYLGEMAAALARELALGKRDAADLLGVSFAALDYVGHAFGPDSHEVQDTLVRLDETVGALLDALDAHVGRDGYVVGLSADHGVGPIPESRVQAGLEGGRIIPTDVIRVANRALAPTLGPGRHVVRVDNMQIYLSEEARARVEAEPSLLTPAIGALAAHPGIERVLPAAGLEHQRTSDDPAVRAAALSYYPGRSGQMVIIPRPYYVVSAATAVGTTHGTLHPYDQHVPLIFFGAGIKAGRYTVPSTPADLAPTLAATIDLTLPGIDGQAQTVALAP